MNPGCSVFSYDHTVSHPAERGRNIKFFKTGLGVGENLETLKNLINANHHEISTIDYLKVDDTLFYLMMTMVTNRTNRIN